MDSRTFDRIAKALSGVSPRREAIRAALGSGAAATAAQLGSPTSSAKNRRKNKKKKDRCRKIGETCGGKQRCCSSAGNTLCQAFDNSECLGIELDGFRCCGTEGTRCDPNFGERASMNPINHGNCSCCGNLFCGQQMDGSFRCQTEDT